MSLPITRQTQFSEDLAINSFQYHALIVDDEPSLRQLLARALSKVGIRCNTAENGMAALDMCQRHTYDLVIVDLKMPQMNGHALCLQLIQRQDQRPEICVLTGIMQDLIDEDLRKRGIKHLYRKPVDYKEFSQSMLEILKKSEADHTKDSKPIQTASAAATPSSSKHNVVVLSPDTSFCHRIVLASAESPLDVIIALSTDHLLEIVNEKRVDLLIIDQ